MPPTKLASQRLNVGGSPGGLNPVAISGSVGRVSAGRISQNAGNVNYTPMPVPKIQVDTTLASAAKFSQVMLQETMKFQDRQDQVTADQAVLMYSEAARENWTEYSQTEGTEANALYGDVATKSQATMNSILGSIPESARQKAAIRMNSAHNTLMGRAATHNVAQLKIAEQNVLYNKRQTAVLDIAMDPRSIYNPDSEGLTKKDRFIRTFTDQATADEAWRDLIVEAGEKIYLEEGVESAKQFYSGATSPDGKTRIPGIGEVELAGSPKHSTRLQANVLKWQNESIRRENSATDLEIKLQKKQKQETWEKHEAALVSSTVKGIPISKDTLDDWLKAGLADPAKVLAYQKDTYGTQRDVSDPARIMMYEEALARTAANGFKEIDENGNEVNYKNMFEGDSTITSAARTQLRQLQKNLVDPKYQARYSRGKESINTWLKGPTWESGIYDQQRETVINQANRELWSRLAAGESLDLVMKDMEERFNPVITTYKRLPPLRTGEKPQTPEGLRKQWAINEEKYRSGAYTEGEYYSERANLIALAKSLNALKNQNIIPQAK